MEKLLNDFVRDFTFGAIEHMDYSNKSTMYVDSELCDYLDTNDIEESVLNDTMNKIVKKVREEELFDCWIESSNEITIERKEYLDFNELT